VGQKPNSQIAIAFVAQKAHNALDWSFSEKGCRLKSIRMALLIGLSLLAACQTPPQAIELPTLAVLPSLTPLANSQSQAATIPAPIQTSEAAPPPAATLTPLPDSASLASALELIQAYQQQNLSFEYPDGWVAQADADNDLVVYLANSQRVLDAMTSSDSSSFLPQPGDIGVLIFVVPPLIASSGDQPEEVLENFIRLQNDPTITIGTIIRSSIALRPAAMVQVATAEGEGMMIALDATGGFVSLFAITPSGELGQWQNTIEEIAASIVVTAAP
jgi:hypothetical protein